MLLALALVPVLALAQVLSVLALVQGVGATTQGCPKCGYVQALLGWV